MLLQQQQFMGHVMVDELRKAASELLKTDRRIGVRLVAQNASEIRYESIRRIMG